MVASVGHVVVEVTDGFVGGFVLRILLLFLGDALLSVDVPLLQVRRDVSFLRPAVVYVVAGRGGVGVEKGCQSSLCVQEVMEHVFQGCW